MPITMKRMACVGLRLLWFLGWKDVDRAGFQGHLSKAKIMSMSHRYDILHISKDWKLMAIQDVLEKDHVLGCHGFPLDWLADSCLHLW